MRNCEFELVDDQLVCKVCKTGYKLKPHMSPDPAVHHRICRAASGLPPVAVLAWNLAAWGAKWLKGGARAATAEQYAARQAICEGGGDVPRCALYRPDNRCTSCGCYIPWKAAGLSAQGKSDCPLGKWPVIG